MTVNRRVDLLELERSHGRLSEAAYRTGQIVQAVFERMGGIGTSNWCGTSRVDAVLAHEIKMIRMIESAERVQAMVNGIARHLGMIDMRLLRRLLGDRMSFAECAAFEGKGGDRGTSYVATRFRDALEDLAKAWAGKGHAPLTVEDRYADAAAAEVLASRQGSLQFSGRCAARRFEPGAVIRIRVEPYQPGEPQSQGLQQSCRQRLSVMTVELGAEDYIRRDTLVTAVRFDGSLVAALAIEARFPEGVSLYGDPDEVLRIRGKYGWREVSAGDWVTQDSANGAMRAWSAAEFHDAHSRVHP